MQAELGVRCETSVRCGFDYREGQGPDYRDAPLHPWWVRTGQGAVLEMPVTTVFRGLFGRGGRWLYHRTSSNSHSALARLGLPVRTAFLPQGFPPPRAGPAIHSRLRLRFHIIQYPFTSPALRA